MTRLEKIVKILFVSIMIFYVLFITSFISRVWLLFKIEFLGGIPLLLPVTILYYCIVDTFTPNPKHSTIFGWLYAEALEHVIFPVTFTFLLFIIPNGFLIFSILAFLIYFFYGYIMGTVNTQKDMLKLSMLFVGFFFIFQMFPAFTLALSVVLNLGREFIIFVTMISCVLYFANKLRVEKDFYKGYIMIILGAIASVIVLSI